MYFPKHSLRKSPALVFAAALLVLFSVSPCNAVTSDSPPLTYVGSDACKACHAEEYASFTTYAKKSRSFQSIHISTALLSLAM